MGSNVVLHCGAKPVTRQQLALVACPPGTDTWKPVPHATVLDLVGGMLELSGFRIAKEQLGLTRDENRFFGTLDLQNELAPGVTLSVGVRNSTDQSLPLGFCAGNRVFVCDNLSFSSELIVKRKHTKNGETRFREAISLAVGNLAQFQAAETRRIQILQGQQLGRHEAEACLLSAFEKGILSARTLPKAIEQYRQPRYDWGSRESAWFLFNAITAVLQPRARSNPQAFSLTTMQLVSLFFPSGSAGFDSPPDIELSPDEYTITPQEEGEAADRGMAVDEPYENANIGI